MTRLTEEILTHAEGLPEGVPVSAKGLLHLGIELRWIRRYRAWPSVGSLFARVAGSIFVPSPAGSERECLRSSRPFRLWRLSAARSLS